MEGKPSNIFEAQSKANMNKIRRLSELVNERRRSFQTGDNLINAVARIEIGYPGTSLNPEDYIIVNKITTEKRILCRVMNKRERDCPDLKISIPLDWKSYHVLTLKERQGENSCKTLIELDLSAKHDWTRPIQSDEAKVQSEMSVRCVGRVYSSDAPYSRLVLRSAKGTDHLVSMNSTGSFQALRHPIPLTLKSAVTRFSLPLDFSIQFPATSSGSSQMGLKNQHSSYNFTCNDFFSIDTSPEMTSFKDDVAESVECLIDSTIRAFSFINFDYIFCQKLDVKTWKRIGPEIILPCFTFDKIRVVEINTEPEVHHVNMLAFDYVIGRRNTGDMTSDVSEQDLSCIWESVYLHGETEEHQIKETPWKVVQINEISQSQN